MGAALPSASRRAGAGGGGEAAEDSESGDGDSEDEDGDEGSDDDAEDATDRQEGDDDDDGDPEVLARLSKLEPGSTPAGHDAKRLAGILKQHHLFADLPETVSQRLAKALTYAPYEYGTVVTRQGDQDLSCYLVDQGVLDVEVDGVQVFRLKRNAIFGEMALLTGEPRAASVRCMSNVKLWVLDNGTFLEHAADAVRVKRELWAARLARIPAFAALQQYELHFVADSLEKVAFDAGAVIIKQGDEGDCMFIVESGECYATVEVGGRLPETVATYGPGGFFGERSLLQGDRRGASVIAKTDVQLASLGEQRFSALLAGAGGYRVRQRLIEHARAYQKAKSQYVDDKLQISDADASERLEALIAAPAPPGAQRPTGERRIARLAAALKSSVAFGDVPLELRIAAARLMQLRLVESGEDLIRMDDKGEHMFVVEAGELDVIIGSSDNEQAVFRCEAGSCIGEQSLMHNVTRNATVRACARGAKAWSLDRVVFESCCRERIKIKRGLSMTFLAHDVILTKSWAKRPLAALADALFPRAYRKGSRLWDQGDPPDEQAAFFLVESGSLVVEREPLKMRSIGGAAGVDELRSGHPREVARLSRGSFFGELALLPPRGSRLAVRTASVTCLTDAQALCTTAADFRRLASEPSVRVTLERAAAFYT